VSASTSPAAIHSPQPGPIIVIALGKMKIIGGISERPFSHRRFPIGQQSERQARPRLQQKEAPNFWRTTGLHWLTPLANRNLKQLEHEPVRIHAVSNRTE
jgi:hypothetical protein